MYLVGALATALDFKLTKDELLGCSMGDLNAAIDRIDRSLAGILVPTDESRTQYVLRHRVIAEHVLDTTAPRVLLREAYERLIVVLALDMGHSPNRQARVFRLYRALINHRPMYRRFGNAIIEARAVYDRIQSIVKHDYHYWLQYGLLELDFGTIDLAAPYLESARELDGNDDYVHTAVAHLRFRQSLDASSLAQAEELRREGEVELRRQIDIRGNREYKVYHPTREPAVCLGKSLVQRRPAISFRGT